MVSIIAQLAASEASAVEAEQELAKAHEEAEAVAAKKRANDQYDRGSGAATSDVRVYRDQLREIERDLTRGFFIVSYIYKLLIKD